MTVEDKLSENDSFWCRWNSDPFCERHEYEYCMGNDCPLKQRYDSSLTTVITEAEE